jgi:hypothetical protein
MKLSQINEVSWGDRNVHTINQQFTDLWAMVNRLSKKKAAVRGKSLDKIRSRLDALEAKFQSPEDFGEPQEPV